MRLECIESLSDPRVADYRNVRDADLRADRGLFMAEGRLGVSRLLSGSRFRARSVFVTQAALHALHDVLESLPDDTPVYLAKPRVLKEIVGYDMHRGCLAAGERGAPLGAEDILAGCPPGAASLALLEDVTNPDNVGGILRNADFGHARERPQRVALVLRTEGTGLSAAALAGADERVTIRMAPGVDSLNVATASGIAFHYFAQMPKEFSPKAGKCRSEVSPCAP